MDMSTPNYRRTATSRRRARGFTLVEIMVAMTISLLVLIALVVFRPQGLFGKREELMLRARR